MEATLNDLIELLLTTINLTQVVSYSFLGGSGESDPPQ